MTKKAFTRALRRARRPCSSAMCRRHLDAAVRRKAFALPPRPGNFGGRHAKITWAAAAAHASRGQKHVWEDRHARADAGLAAVVPSHHRSRRAQSRRAAGDLALGRRPDPYHELCRGPRARALRVAQRLERDGIKLGDRVATLAWNTWRHLEAWYGIMGIGAVYHTVNPRLFPDQIVLDRQPCRGSRDDGRHHASCRSWKSSPTASSRSSASSS